MISRWARFHPARSVSGHCHQAKGAAHAAPKHAYILSLRFRLKVESYVETGAERLDESRYEILPSGIERIWIVPRLLVVRSQESKGHIMELVNQDVSL
jgi:hypothetical protein